MNITLGMNKSSLGSMDRLNFERFDTNDDGVINYAEFNNFLQVTGLNKVERKRPERQENKGFNLEQFDPSGPINFESNGGFNARKLNIIA